MKTLNERVYESLLSFHQPVTLSQLNAAEALKITSKDLLEFGIIDEEIVEPLGGAHADYQDTANNMKSSIVKALDELSKLSVDKLREERYAKFRAMGRFIEG